MNTLVNTLAPETSNEPLIDKTKLGVTNESLAIALGFILMAFYVAPIFLITISAWNTNGFQDESLTFSWFAAFMKSSDSTLNQFHKILLPVMTAISVIAFRERPSKTMLSLFGFVMLAFIMTVSVRVFFDMPNTLIALKNQVDPIDISLVKAFFSRIEESLMMYLMMLLGINVVNAKK